MKFLALLICLNLVEKVYQSICLDVEPTDSRLVDDNNSTCCFVRYEKNVIIVSFCGTDDMKDFYS